MSIYLITNYGFNHDKKTGAHNLPIDPRFLSSDRNYIYYLTDFEIPKALQNKELVLERDFDPIYKKAGKQHLAEWATFLAEKKYRFAKYPMYILSSRFYQKNGYLEHDLNTVWDDIFNGLKKSGYGMLPSYDRPLRWIYPKYAYTHPKYQKKLKFFPFRAKAFELIEAIYGIHLKNDFPHYIDLQCDYFGFESYEHFSRFMDFYQPIFDYFFTPDFELKRNLNDYFYVGCSTHRAEKPVTYLLEYFSHLFFALERLPFFAYHYTGQYTVYTREKCLKPIVLYSISKKKRLIRSARECQNWIRYESMLPKPIRSLCQAPFDAMEKMIKSCNLNFLRP